ncbi:MAG: molybdopterin synthase catalytic subunit MoaE [Pseudomonadota bacterium]
MNNLNVSVQTEDFDAACLQRELLSASNKEGAVVTFTGYVRSENAGQCISGLLLEHYSGMTERSILHILNQAAERWPIAAASVVHRVGLLGVGDQIVWVGVSSAHREAAFSACEFVMDYLKNEAPFWKKESTAKGDRWVEARATDEERARRWTGQTGN